ncbi:hypothetical protein BC477_17370 [Clavibacter michiganensis subsp. michiganensis]|uniref:Uncharacterized protein n=1 Tax=Clavibacter michiganensis subsp. michiganensis TaxID=33013 RepID=A0A251XDD1_CLAMM|nr:hypothetical protein BC477_17370 [Clavibacter michiganensis subsp. michiganensis]OUE00324.1 hypothetical protein CMMCAS07_18135 [Clavibacter michiganensis subsp. michiganensis]
MVQDPLARGGPRRRQVPPVLAAELVGRVEQGDARPATARGDRGSQPGRTRADHDDVPPVVRAAHDASPARASGTVAPGPVSTTSPSTARRWQARTSGSPFTVTVQSKHTPIPQKTPRGRPALAVVRQASVPEASRAPAMVWPLTPSTDPRPR